MESPYNAGRRLAASLAGLLVVVLFPACAGAGLLQYDGFESYGANSALGTLNNNTWGGPWSTAASGLYVRNVSLTYDNGTVHISGGNNVVQVEDAINIDAAASRLLSAAQTGTTLYYSFLFRAAAGQEGSDFLQFALNDDTAINNSGSIGDLSATPTDSRLGARIGGSNGGTTTSSATSIASGTTYFLVGRMRKSASSGGDTSGVNYDRMDLLINPSSLTEPADASWSATRIASSGRSSIAYFTFRTSGLDTGDRYQFDELRIGDTFASVVPEPATLSLLAAGLLFARRALRR